MSLRYERLRPPMTVPGKFIGLGNCSCLVAKWRPIPSCQIDQMPLRSIDACCPPGHAAMRGVGLTFRRIGSMQTQASGPGGLVRRTLRFSKLIAVDAHTRFDHLRALKVDQADRYACEVPMAWRRSAGALFQAPRGVTGGRSTRKRSGQSLVSRTARSWSIGDERQHRHCNSLHLGGTIRCWRVWNDSGGTPTLG
jgi:hypothetical protein